MSPPLAVPAQPNPTLSPPLSLREYHLILTRRLSTLSLPETPHLHLSETLQTQLTQLSSMFFFIRLLHLTPIQTFRSRHPRLALLPLALLPPPRTLLLPLFRFFPPLLWISVPLRLLSVPTLLSLPLTFIRRRFFPSPPPRPTPLTTAREQISSFIARHRPPPLHTPTKRRVGVAPPASSSHDHQALHTPLPRQQPDASRPRPLTMHSPLFALLPRSIARDIYTPPPPQTTVSSNGSGGNNN